jgi:molybdopterin-guanine dinucleotide biosynthesis protein A
MGQNKALLVFHGRTLIEIAAGVVRDVAGNITIVGPPEIYSRFGLPVVPDLRAGVGPLAGIESALTRVASSAGPADWALVVACDMPRLDRSILHQILDQAAAHPEALAVLPESAEGRVEPLCAAYHRNALPFVRDALDAGIRKVTSAFPKDRLCCIRIPSNEAFQNLNTPEEWSAALETR